MELNYNDIKNELESLKSSNYEEFLINVIVILRTSKEAILKLKKINNANRFYHYLDYLFLHIAFLLGIITKDDLVDYTHLTKNFIRNLNLTNKTLKKLKYFNYHILCSDNIDEIIFLVNSIHLMADNLSDRNCLYGDYNTNIDCLVNGINVMLPDRDMSLDNENKKIMNINKKIMEFKKQ